MGHMGHITLNGAQMGHKLISKKNKAIAFKTSRIFLRMYPKMGYIGYTSQSRVQSRVQSKLLEYF